MTTPTTNRSSLYFFLIAIALFIIILLIVGGFIVSYRHVKGLNLSKITEDMNQVQTISKKINSLDKTVKTLNDVAEIVKNSICKGIEIQKGQLVDTTLLKVKFQVPPKLTTVQLLSDDKRKTYCPVASGV